MVVIIYGFPSFFVFSWSLAWFPKNLLIVWVLCHFTIYIYEADHPTPPFRDITKPLLIYLWVSQLALFQHHVTSVHQSAHMIQAWPPAHWFLSMPLSGSFTSSNVNLIGKTNHATLTTNQRVLCPSPNVYMTTYPQQSSSNWHLQPPTV